MSIQNIASTLLGFERSQFFAFKADNHPESTFHVVDFSVEEGLSTPFTIQLTLASSNGNLTEDDIVDKLGVLTLYKNQLVERYFHGVVFAFARGDTGRHHTFYTMTLVPEFSRLSLRTNSRIFQGKSVMDITEELLNEMNISNYALALRHEHEPREYCVQYCESDEAFIERLLSEEGIFYYFEHTKESHTIVFADDNSVVQDIPFPCLYNNHSGGVAETSYIRRLEVIVKVKPTDVVLNDYSFKQPSSDFKKSTFANHAGYQSQYEHYMYPGRYKDHKVGEAFTQTRVDYLRSDAKTIEGEGDISQLTSGYMMKIEDHPTIQINQEWLITLVKHYGTQPQSLENAGGEGLTQYHNTFYVLPKQQQWKPQPEPKPHIYGPQIAKVVGPEGEEIYTDEFGRVKVQFPWDRYGQSDDKSSCWIRVAQDWAGAGYGGIMIPRIGHEVIVSFLEGDPDQPIVTGRAFHATNKQQYKLPALKTQASLKSKEHKSGGYGELLLDDTTGEIKTQIHSTHGATQLTMGYLTHPRKGDGSGEHRGDGFELRTDEWGAIRAGKGLYISTEKREKAIGKQLDIDESIAQLEHALYIAKEIKKASEVAKLPLNDVGDQESQLNSTYKEIKESGLLMHSPEGIALTSPKSIQSSSQKNVVVTSGENIEISSFLNTHIAAKDQLSIMAIKDEMKIVTNQGELKIQSQNNKLQLLGNNEVSILSTDDKVVMAAEKEIVLTSGKAYIKIKDGKVEIGGPGELLVKTSGMSLVGPSQMDYDFLSFGTYDPKITDEMFVLKDKDGNPIPNFKYRIERSDGEKYFGTTNAKGETTRVSTGAEGLELKLFKDTGE